MNVNGSLSKSKTVTSGVAQGSVLGPTLFLLFIDDIGADLKSDHLLFADDLKLFTIDPTNIEADLRVLENRCSNWQMKVAPNKCEYVPFTTKNNSNNSCSFQLNNTLIPKTNHVRDLGVHLSSDPSFAYHYNLTIRKAQQRINIFFNVLKMLFLTHLSNATGFTSSRC